MPVAGTRSASVRRPGTPLTGAGTAAPGCATVPSWATATATAERHRGTPGTLPLLGAGPHRVVVIDLRDDEADRG